MSEQRVKYSYAGKESLEDILSKSFPKQLIPTKKTNTYLGIIFLMVLAMAFVEFPYASLTTGDTDITISVGYPWPFLEFNLIDIESNPLLIGGLIFDLIIYFFIAYIADIATTLILKNPSLMSKEDTKKVPKIFEDKKARTIAEKLTEKVAKKQEFNLEKQTPSPEKINNTTLFNPQNPKQPSP